MSNEPFGRQPKLVKVILEGEEADVTYWKGQLMQRAEFKGDIASSFATNSFTIYPRAVND